MKMLSFLLAAGFIFHSGAAHEFCENRSAIIENGEINCNRNPHHHPVRYDCNINCKPGYQAESSTPIFCQESSTQVIREDNEGKRTRVYTGTWQGDFESARCLVPTTCPSFPEPLDGRAFYECSTTNESSTCFRNCVFPYEASQPEHREEHCGPDTNFFWSHVQRNNVNTIPPCVAPQKCRPLEKSDMPEHGHVICNFQDWAKTHICELKCERGYVAKNVYTKVVVFCGPTTGYIWSHVLQYQNSYPRMAGCEQSPVTAEFTFALSRPCEEISTSEKDEGWADSWMVVITELERLDSKMSESLLRSYIYCENSPNATSSSARLDSSGSGMNTSSELTFGFYYRTDCNRGKCSDACRVLKLSKDTDCFNICMMMAETIPTNPIRHLHDAYLGQLIKSIEGSAFSGIIRGANFKSLNVTISTPEDIVITDSNIRHITNIGWLDTYYELGDSC